MKIVSWNCGGASRYGNGTFNKVKQNYVEKYKADIYVIQECTKDDIENLNKANKTFYCDNVDSEYGIGIFSDKFKIELLPEHNSEYRYVLPYKISSENSEFVLFAVWTKNKDKNNKTDEYSELYTVQIWKAINYEMYRKFLKGHVILIGDFNSNSCWENEYDKNKLPSHKSIVDKLLEYNIESAYHKYFICDHGQEENPTELFRMDINKQYHVDYCFFSKDYELKNVEVENLDEWKKTKYSDHCPIMVELI